jgi:O-antigen/teichoic acid export membrane protein
VVASTLLIGRAIGVCLQRIALRRRSPWIVYGFSKVKFSRVKRLAVPAVAYMGFPLGEAVTFQGIVLTIGVVLGPVAVVIFSAYRTVTRVAAQLNTVINHTVWPELSSAYGASHLKLARSLYHHAANASLWISLAVVSMLSISGNWIISVCNHQ